MLSISDFIIFGYGKVVAGETLGFPKAGIAAKEVVKLTDYGACKRPHNSSESIWQQHNMFYVLLERLGQRIYDQFKEVGASDTLEFEAHDLQQAFNHVLEALTKLHQQVIEYWGLNSLDRKIPAVTVLSDLIDLWRVMRAEYLPQLGKSFAVDPLDFIFAPLPVTKC
jgi:hypothetical protein